MTDARLFHTRDGGEMLWENGEPELSSDGLETAVYLSLFGGNYDDSGLSKDDARQWWGNLTEESPENTYRSKTQSLLASLPPTAANARLIVASAESDLNWLVSTGVAKSVSVAVRVPSRNRVDITVLVLIDAESKTFRFESLWPLNGSTGNT